MRLKATAVLTNIIDHRSIMMNEYYARFKKKKTLFFYQGEIIYLNAIKIKHLKKYLSFNSISTLYITVT